MKVLQINAVYEKYSTGRTTQELHIALKKNNEESFVASPYIGDLKENAFQIGNKLDRKIHSFLSRISGKQGYYSKRPTLALLDYIDDIKPDVVVLRNLHGNYINIPMILSYLGEKDIATVVVLHDSFFYTGKCVYYIEDYCYKWKEKCGNCPALRKGNPSFFFDQSAKMLEEKKRLFSKIKKLAVIGVSDWVTRDASESIIGNAAIVRRIYNWIDLDKFKPRDTKTIREELKLEDKFVLLGISMIWNVSKGIEIFMELSKILPEKYQIVLVGEYDKELYRSNKINFLGTVKDVDYLAKLYAMADIFVNPTIQDTFGKTTAEAMASGTPVVAYNCTALPELLSTGGSCGELIDDYTAEAFYEGILNVANNKDNDYKVNCRKRAEELFDKEKNIQEYITLFEKLMYLNFEGIIS